MVWNWVASNWGNDVIWQQC